MTAIGNGREGRSMVRWIFALVSLMGFGAFSVAFVPFVGYLLDYEWLCRMGEKGPSMALNTATSCTLGGLATTLGFVALDRLIVRRFWTAWSRLTRSAV